MLLVDFITFARQFVGDGYTDNLARYESLNQPDEDAPIDGSNKNFVTENFPLSVTSGLTNPISVYVDGALTSAYTIDIPTGRVTFTNAPQQSAFITYYYLLMSDTAWTDFIQDGLRRIGLSTGNPTTDVPTVNEGLLAAVNSYACGNWAKRIAGQSGLWYNQRLQERNEDRDTISKKFLTMSQDFMKDGDIARDDFYKGLGRQFKPGMRIVQHVPRQITPSR